MDRPVYDITDDYLECRLFTEKFDKTFVNLRKISQLIYCWNFRFF